MSDQQLISAAFLTALLACASIPAQDRPVRVLTATNEIHTDARISPDGLLVAFKAPGKIGVIPYSGGAESPLVVSNTVSDFLWAPNSSGIYYLDGANIRFVARFGGTSVSVATLTGGSHRIWSVDRADTYIYGSRLDTVTSEYRLFRTRTNGATSPVDIAFGAGNIVDEAMVSPNGSKLAYRSYLAFPFTPREYVISNANGSNPVLATVPPVTGDPTSVAWLDDTRLVFSALDAGSARPHLWQTTPSGVAEPLTGGSLGRRVPSVSGNGRWIVFEAQAQGAGTVPAVQRSTGGGVVPLSRTKIYQFRGAATIDDAGQRVVFAGRIAGSTDFEQVHAIDLAREIEVAPRVAAPGILSISMPLAAGEVGGIFLGVQTSPVVIPLFGFTYGVALDPTALVFLASGSGSGGALALSVPLPNDPTITGFQFWLQGLRIGTVLGDFTREVVVQVF